MLVLRITENGKKLNLSQDSDAVKIYAGAKVNSTHTYTITYAGHPCDGLIISTNKLWAPHFFWR